MGRWLLGIEDTASTREGKQQPEKPEDLWTFGTDHPAPPRTARPPSSSRPTWSSCWAARSTRWPRARTAPANWEAARRFLATSLKNRVGLVNPPPESIDHTEVRRLTREGLTDRPLPGRPEIAG